MGARTVGAAAAAAVLAAVSGCAGGGAPGSAASPSPSVSPPGGTADVNLTWRLPQLSHTDPSHVSYEATLTLGEPAQGPGSVCGLTPEDGAGTVPVTLRLVNTDDGADEQGEQGQELLHREEPEHLEAAPVGGAGPLMWQSTDGECSEEIDVAALTSGWSYHQTRTLTGELAGVPMENPGGAGVELGFTAEHWDVLDGADPLRVTY